MINYYPWAATVKAHPALFDGREEPKMRDYYSSFDWLIDIFVYSI